MSIVYAAGLGSVLAPGLGAGDATVTSCDTDGLSVSWGTAYEPLIPGYEITTVNVSGVAQAGCANARLQLQLTTTGGTTLGLEKVVPDIDGLTAFGFDFTSENIDVADVEDIHIVIIGP